MAIRQVSIGPLTNFLTYDDTVNPPSAPFTIVPQATPAAASTSHSTSDFAGVNSALNALGTAINNIRTALINAGVLT